MANNYLDNQIMLYAEINALGHYLSQPEVAKKFLDPNWLAQIKPYLDRLPQEIIVLLRQSMLKYAFIGIGTPHVVNTLSQQHGAARLRDIAWNPAQNELAFTARYSDATIWEHPEVGTELNQLESAGQFNALIAWCPTGIEFAVSTEYDSIKFLRTDAPEIVVNKRSRRSMAPAQKTSCVYAKP